MCRAILSSILVLSFVFFNNTDIFAADDLRLNPNLDYNSDSDEGPLITGSNMSDGTLKPDRSAYVIFSSRECFNSKRQAKRTVELYEKYKDRVDFIVLDLDTRLSDEQKDLKSRFYSRYIPHVTIIDKGKAVYNSSGEVSTDKILKLLDIALK